MRYMVNGRVRASAQIIYRVKSMRIFRPALFVLLITLIGAFLRVHRLAEFPPALFWDEGYDGLDALRVAQIFVHPIFFEGNNGREPLTIYLQAMGIILWGAIPWTLRIVPAMIGIVTIPMTYRLGAEIFGGDARAKFIGVLAAGMLAVSFWHVALARLSLRVISFPLFNALTVWLFWRAWNRQRKIDFAGAGVALGITLYTYLAARFLPFILIGFIVAAFALAVTRRGEYPQINSRKLLIGDSVMLGATIIIALPLLAYFGQNPEAFLLRPSSISIFAYDPTGGATSLPENALRILRMFIDHGDWEARHNLPGRPALDPVMAIGFWSGLVFALIRFATQPRYLLLLAWLVANLIPTLLSTEAPHFLRSAGALAPMFLIASDGLTLLWQRAQPRLGWSPMVIAVIAFSGTLTFNDYFNNWGPSRRVYHSFDGATQTLIERAMELSRDYDVVLPLRLYGHPAAQFYFANRFEPAMPLENALSNRPVVWLFAGFVEREMILLRDNRTYVPQPMNDAQVARLNDLGNRAAPVKNRFDQTIATELQLDNPREFVTALKPAYPVDANYSNQIQMFGYDVQPTTLAPGGKFRVTYYWRALTNVASDFFITSNLIDPRGESFGQINLEPVFGKYPTGLWRRGATIADAFEFTVPKTAPPGKYRLQVGVLNRNLSSLLVPMLSAEDRLLLDPITVEKNKVDPNAIKQLTQVRFGAPASLTLIGYDVTRAARRGESLGITLYWKFNRTMPVDYSIFMHLIDVDGKIVAQQDGPPQNGNAPTSWWRNGDLIADVRELSIPGDVRAGRYTLAIGVYNSADGARLPVIVNDARQSNDAWQISLEINP